MKLRILAMTFASALFTVATQAQTLTTIGVTQLRALDPTLTGTGVPVAQPEADSSNDFEVNPGVVGQPQSLFTYINSTGATVTGTFPNGVGTESGHADSVGDNFYGITNGVAPGVQHVDNYDADYFVNTYIGNQTAIPAKVVNQSFIFLSSTSTPIIEQAYDDYVATYNTIFVSGAGNGGSPFAPSTAYNSISVAAYGGSSSVGPTTGGRSKPDITAPAGATSFSTPLVAGAAAILVEAGQRGDGGIGTATAATDARTVKALLLNGAVKQSGWTHTSTAPLDTAQGAGLLNVFNSYVELAAGEHTFIASTTSQTPPVVGGNVSSLDGWNFDTSITSTPASDAVRHYFFDLNSSLGTSFNLTSTLVWERQLNESDINNLDLFLYTDSGTLVDSSVSTVDNVEHIFKQNIAPGRYDLEVLKHAGVPTVSDVSNTETYALAFKFSPVPEPSSLLFLAMGATWFVIRRRSR